MPLGSVTIGSQTYEPRQLGVYVLSTNTFTDTFDEFRVKGGTKTSNGRVMASVTKVTGKDVSTSGGGTVRRSLPSTIQIQVDPGFTAAEVVADIQKLAAFMTEARVNRILSGDQ